MIEAMLPIRSGVTVGLIEVGTGRQITRTFEIELEVGTGFNFTGEKGTFRDI